MHVPCHFAWSLEETGSRQWLGSAILEADAFTPRALQVTMEHVPMVHVQCFLAHAFIGFVILGYKNTLWASQPENNATIDSVLLVMTGL